MDTLGGGKPAPPAVQDSLEKHVQTGGATILLCGCAAAVFCVGIAVGASGYAAWLWLHRPGRRIRIACAAATALIFLLLDRAVVFAWLWRDLFAGSVFPGITVKGVGAGSAARSFAVELLAAPATLELGLLGYRLMRRSLGAQIRRDQRADTRRWRAVTERPQLHTLLPRPLRPQIDTSTEHPPGCIRLGIDRETERPFDLQLPKDIANNVFMPGTTGAGKTTTLRRIAAGALTNGYAAVIVDCKGTDLRPAAQELAQRFGVPFYLVDPDDPMTLGYNPCSGDASAVANKLIGAFSYGPSAEVYKHAAMEIVPLVVRGLIASGADVTLEALYEACAPRGMSQVARSIPPGADDRVRQRLLALGAGDDDHLGKKGYKGLQRRFGALLEGKFGDLFRAQRMLDWDAALSRPSVVYIALSTLASSEDVELMGRVIAQDLKQLCARRLGAILRGERVTPALAIIDEFAALREAEQLSDLLLQARSAMLPTVISTQYIPESYSLSKSLLGTGLLICHRVESEDANALAEALGTRTRTELTNQLDFETGFAHKGSIRQVQAYAVHPNDLRDFRTGYVAVRSTPTHRHAIVRVTQEGQ